MLDLIWNNKRMLSVALYLFPAALYMAGPGGTTLHLAAASALLALGAATTIILTRVLPGGGGMQPVRVALVPWALAVGVMFALINQGIGPEMDTTLPGGLATATLGDALVALSAVAFVGHIWVLALSQPDGRRTPPAGPAPRPMPGTAPVIGTLPD